MKHALATATCAAALVASLAACSGADNKSAPTPTGGTSRSTTATTRPTTTPTTAVPAGSPPAPAPLAAHSTYAYGDLNVVVNLPADIPNAARPSLRLLSAFLQADGRTIAKNTLDPALPGLASPSVVKYVKSTTGGESVQGIGSVIFTIDKVRTGASGYAVISGCTDQSKLVQVRKDGSHYVDAGTKQYPTLKMTAEVNPAPPEPGVMAFTFAVGTCS